jgi:hypothetical protein
MKRMHQRLITGLVVGLVVGACSDRRVEEEEPLPDIEGLCKEYCARVMECRWYPGATADFSTEEGCRRSCEGGITWEACPRENEALYACHNQYDCPEFADVGNAQDNGAHRPEGLCVEEMIALTACASRRDR